MRILMVCMGNICRSPLAEAILKDKLKLAGIVAEVESAGTIRYHEGEGADQRAKETARHHKISLDSHTARGVRPSDFDRFDKIYVMDSTNYHDLRTLAENRFQREQIDYLMNTVFPGQNREVPDPYYGGKDGFEKVFQMLDKACDQIVLQMRTGTVPNL